MQVVGLAVPQSLISLIFESTLRMTEPRCPTDTKFSDVLETEVDLQVVVEESLSLSLLNLVQSSFVNI